MKKFKQHDIVVIAYGDKNWRDWITEGDVLKITSNSVDFEGDYEAQFLYTKAGYKSVGYVHESCLELHTVTAEEAMSQFVS